MAFTRVGMGTIKPPQNPLMPASSQTQGGGRGGGGGGGANGSGTNNPFIPVDVEFDVKNAPNGFGDFVMRDNILIEPAKVSINHIRNAAGKKLVESLGLPEAPNFQLFYLKPTATPTPPSGSQQKHLLDTIMLDELLSEMEQSGTYKLKLMMSVAGSGSPTIMGGGAPTFSGGPAPIPVGIGAGGGGSSLTAAALGQLQSGGKVDPALALPIYNTTDLTMPKAQQRGAFRFQGIVRAVRRKNQNIVEVELEEKTAPSQNISVVSYTPASSAALEKLERNKLVEVRNARCTLKTATDIQYQTNPHSHRLIVDEHSKIVVIGNEFEPARPIVVNPHEQAGNGVKTFGGGSVATASVAGSGVVSSVAKTKPRLGPATMGMAPTLATLPPSNGLGTSGIGFGGGGGGAPSIASGSIQSYSTGAGSGQSNKRTLFVPPPQSAATMSSMGGIVGPAPIPCSNASGVGPAPIPLPKMTASSATAAHIVRTADVMARDGQLGMLEAKHELKMDKVKRKVPAIRSCGLCNFDLDSGESVRKLVDLAHKIQQRNPGMKVVTDPKVFPKLFSDPRTHGKQASLRITCSTATVVNPVTMKHHRVHARCAHISDGYQKGEKLSDALMDGQTTLCHLCGERGALARCYHADCNKWYHTACALLTSCEGGHVDMGPRDPLFPVPSCPTHKFVPTNRSGGGANKKNPSAAAEDPTLFDSSVVNAGDLRDPDDDDEEEDFD